jgi:NTE family protein
LRAASKLGLFDARSARNLIRETVGSKSFSDLGTLCHLAATDLRSGQIVWLTEGSLFNALSACIAMPGLVTPVDYNDHLLVDAYMTNPLPIDAVVTAGADKVIASTVIPVRGARDDEIGSRAAPQDLVSGWLAIADIVARERVLDHIYAADILIAPNLTDVSNDDFGQAQDLIDTGRAAASEALPRIRAALALEA